MRKAYSDFIGDTFGGVIAWWKWWDNSQLPFVRTLIPSGTQPSPKAHLLKSSLWRSAEWDNLRCLTKGEKTPSPRSFPPRAFYHSHHGSNFSFLFHQGPGKVYCLFHRCWNQRGVRLKDCERTVVKNWMLCLGCYVVSYAGPCVQSPAPLW